MATDAAGVNPKGRRYPTLQVKTIIYYDSPNYNIINQYNLGRKVNMPSREEMIAYITETIHTATDLELEQYYWLLLMESPT